MGKNKKAALPLETQAEGLPCEGDRYAKKNFYAVQNGRDGDGVYESWDACKAQVHGVKGVVYKGFPTRQEAEDFLQRAGASTTEGEAPGEPPSGKG